MRNYLKEYGPHAGVSILISNNKYIFCTMCRTEENIARKLNLKLYCGSAQKTTLVYCHECGMYVHIGLPRNNSKWGIVSGLCGNNYFEIIHSKTCIGIWKRKDIGIVRNAVLVIHLTYKLVQSKYDVC